MEMWLQGFQVALSGQNPLFLMLGTLIGLVVGVLPAIGPSFGVTLALPFTYGMDPAAALIFLTAIQSSCAYGDSIASILINVPGGPGTVASMWEGYPMSRQGRAGTALGIATGASFIGGLIGWLSFVLLAGPMTAFAMVIGAPEYFVLGIMALALMSIASRGQTVKGLVMGAVGLLVGMIGVDPVSGVTDRFSFGLEALAAPIDVTLGALAIFALPQLITMLEEGGTIAHEVAAIKDSVFGGVVEVVKRPLTVIRGGVIGWLIGVLPAIGTSAAGVTSYLIEKRFSKERDSFGKGSIDGLTAAETGKGACILGDGITSLMLGVPGSVTWAILMAALIIHGIDPGPRFMTAGVLPYTVFVGLLLGQLAYFVIGILLVRHMTRIVHIPNEILAPVIAILCFLGAYVARNYVFDIWIMVALGIFAYGAQKNGFPTVPMILGFILSKLIEGNFHRALAVGFGSYSVFVTRPIALAMVIITLVFFAGPGILALIRRRQVAAGETTAELDEIAGKQTSEIAFEEFLFGGLVAIVLLIFLTTSFTYTPDVRLFPVIVSAAGLLLVLFWSIRTISTKKITMSFETSSARGGLAWFVTLFFLVLYAILVPLAGFLIASVAFFLIVVLLSGYKLVGARLATVGATTVGIAAFLLLFAQFLQVELPVGFLGW